MGFKVRINRTATGRVGQVTPPPVGQALKFNPGHYWWVTGTWSTGQEANHFALMDQAIRSVAGANTRGFLLQLGWKSYERKVDPNNTGGADAFGVYDYGDSIIQRYVDKCNSYNPPRQLMVRLAVSGFGTPNGLFPGFLPTYLSNSSYGSGTGIIGGAAVCPVGAKWAGSLQGCARYWSPSVNDRLIALATHFGQRWNAEPRLEQVDFYGETSVAPQSGMTAGAIITEETRLFTTTASYFQNTQLRCELNFLGSDPQARQMINACVANGVAIGGPDDPNERAGSTTAPTTGPGSHPASNQGARLYRGIDSDLVTRIYPDMRGVGCWVGETQIPDLGNGKPNDFTRPASAGDGYLSSIYAEAQLMQASYMVWPFNTSTGPNDNRTTTFPSGSHPDLYDFVASIQVPNKAYPSSFPTP